MPDADVIPAAAGPSESHIQAIQRWLGDRAAPSETDVSVHVSHYRCTAAQTPGFHLASQRRVRAPVRPGVRGMTQATLVQGAQGEADARPQPGHAVRLQVYETDDAQAAQALLVEVLTGFNALPPLPPPTTGIGDIDIVLPGEHIGVFTRGNLVAVLSALGPQAPPVSQLARQIDAFLIRPASAFRDTPRRATRMAARAPSDEEPPMTRHLAAGRVRLAAMPAVADAPPAAPEVKATDRADVALQVDVYDEAQGEWRTQPGATTEPPGPPPSPPAPPPPSPPRSRRRS